MLGYTDEEGRFAGLTTRNEVWVHAIGYQITYALSDTVHMNPISYEIGHEIVVEGSASEKNLSSYTQHTNGEELEHLLQTMDGVSVIQRGAYAWEPSIRGLDDQRIQVTIDGMQVFKACVDKMDPITAYVDTDNLERLRVDKSGSSIASGSGKAGITLVTKKAEFSPFSLETESTYRLPDGYRSLSAQTAFSNRNNAIRASFTHKEADNIIAGGGKEVSLSGYQKSNLNLQYRYRLKGEKKLELGYILDHAQDVGYPALLMDATQATAHIFRAEMQWLRGPQSPSHRSIMMYANTVEHLMDDYSRDVTQRAVMRNMHMPMKGETFTYGVRWNEMIHLDKHRLQVFTEAYHSSAFGDMTMESLLGIPDMYLINLGDIETFHGSTGFSSHWFPTEATSIKLETGLAYNRVLLGDDVSRSFFDGMISGASTPRSFTLPSISMDALVLLTSKFTIRLNGVYAHRAPSYTELYGHYIYNYVDGFFYDGNPNLQPEKTSNAEVSLQWDSKRNSWSLTGHVRLIEDYIFGEINADLSNSFYQFKQYTQQGNALIGGLELRWLADWGSYLTSDIRASYLYGDHLSEQDPLPFIAPLNGLGIIRYIRNSWKLGWQVEAVANQERISKVHSNEDVSEGFLVIGAELTKSLKDEKWSIQLKAKNLADRYYHRHESIGNIPELGRSIQVSLRYTM